MTDLVIFVEERSAGIVVDVLAARIAPEKTVRVIEHEGKQDLKRSYPKKINAWRHPTDVPFLVLHDNDGGDCRSLKAVLLRAVPQTGVSRTKVRLVMQHLESWYLGDAPALVAAGLLTPSRAVTIAGSAKFRDPDLLGNAKLEFHKLHKQTGQILLARRIAPHLNLDTNRSHSFRLLVSTLRDLLGA